MGYGRVPVNVWNTSETTGENINISGDFSLAISVQSAGWGRGGATFSNRILDVSNTGSEYTACTSNFQATITASYTGNKIETGISKIKLVIDNISIYVGNYPDLDGGGGGDDVIRWMETTSGNINTSSSLNLGVATPHSAGTKAYDHLAWTPPDKEIAGTASKRTFELNLNGFTKGYCDGFEVTGHVEYTVTKPGAAAERQVHSVIPTNTKTSKKQSSVSPVELMIDVDTYDNLSEPQYYGADTYDPNEIAKFFVKCRENGVSLVYWRVQCQIATYRSKLNYNVSEEMSIRSYPDARHRSGAFAAKIGVHTAEDGIFQIVDTAPQQKYTFTALISANNGSSAYLRVEDLNTGKTIATSKNISTVGTELKSINLEFEATGTSRIGIYGANSKDINTFVVDDVSVCGSNGINLASNGDMEMIDALTPTDWQITPMVNFIVLCGDVNDLSAEDQTSKFKSISNLKSMREGGWKKTRLRRAKSFKQYDNGPDPLAVAVREAHKNGIKLYAWVDPLDDGRKVPPMCSGWWVSRFHEDNPQYRLVDKDGNRRWGLLCYGYPEVIKYKNAIITELLDYDVDGIYLKTAFQHNLIWDSNYHRYKIFQYSDIALAEYNKRWGKPDNGEYRLDRLKIVQGDYFLNWVRSASQLIHKRGKELVFGIKPENHFERNMGEWPNNWRKLVDEKIIDTLLIEPRPSTTNKGILEKIDQTFGYIDRCRKNGVKVGYDFYLNALAENRMRPRKLAARPHGYFVSELKALTQEPIDVLGIYEDMYINRDNYWINIKQVHDFEAKQNNRKMRYDHQSNAENTAMQNIALASEGNTATINSLTEKNIDATAVIDGIDSSYVSMGSTPFELTITLKKPTPIDEIHLYTGILDYSANPSGECGISSYRIEGMVAGKWHNLIAPVTKAETAAQMNALTSIWSNAYKRFYRVGRYIKQAKLSRMDTSRNGFFRN